MSNGQKQMGYSTRENQTVGEKLWANLQAERDVIGDLGRIHNPSQPGRKHNRWWEKWAKDCKNTVQSINGVWVRIILINGAFGAEWASDSVYHHSSFLNQKHVLAFGPLGISWKKWFPEAIVKSNLIGDLLLESEYISRDNSKIDGWKF